MEDIRALFDQPPPRNGKPVVELRALTHGIPPKAAKRNLELFYEEWRVSGVDAWNQLAVSGDVFLVGDESTEERNREFGWWTLPEVIGDRFISRLIHAPAGTCIMMQNATQVAFGILSSIELQQPNRRKVVCTDGEFPSVLHTLENFNRRTVHLSAQARKEVAWDIRRIEIGEELFDADRIIAEIDEKTAIVFVSHVGFVRGERVEDGELKRIADAAHRVGALFAIDGYHALGGKPVHVDKTGADCYFGGLLKEGCGSSGACFLYVRPGLQLTPSISGWFADKDPFAFNLEPIPNPDVRRRFLLGTTPIASLYHGIEGVKIMLRVGLESVGVDVVKKVSSMVQSLVSGGIPVVSPLDESKMSSMIILRVPEANRFREFVLRERNIGVDARRNQYIRFAPHVYNTEDELRYTANSMIEAFQSKEYLKISIDRTGGPVT